MNSLYIDSTASTPEVNFDIDSNLLMISGKSYPEDAIGYYAKVISWLEEYLSANNKEVNLHFDMAYFSTASAKIFVDILFLLKKSVGNSKAIKVKWFYDDYDDDMKEAGKRFSEITNIDIELEPK